MAAPGGKIEQVLYEAVHQTGLDLSIPSNPYDAVITFERVGRISDAFPILYHIPLVLLDRYADPVVFEGFVDEYDEI